MRLVPLGVSCHGPVLRSFSVGGGMARSRRPPAWPWVACFPGGGPVCPGRSGARASGGGGGESCWGGGCASPLCGASWECGSARAGRESWGVRVGSRATGGGGFRSVPLHPLHGHEGWLALHCLRCIGHGGCGLHTARLCVRVLPPGRRPRLELWGGLVSQWTIGGVAGWRARWAGLGHCYLSGVARYWPADVPVAVCGGYRGSKRGNGQEAYGLRTRQRVCRRSRPLVSRRRGVDCRRPLRRGSGGPCLPALRRWSRAGKLQWCRIPRSGPRGGVSRRAAALRRSTAGLEEGDWVLPG